MSDPMRLTDAMVRAALTPEPGIRVPAGLADDIRTQVEAVPQRRRPLLALPASPRARLLLQLAVVGLLALALVGSILFVGSLRKPAPLLAVTTYRGGPERNGVMPGPAPTARPVLEWHVGVHGPIGPGAPVVQDGTVYVGDEGGFITAVDEQTGRLRWSRQLGAPINGGLSIDAGLLVVGDDAGVVHALDLADAGLERWTYPTGAAIHSAAILADGVAYVANVAGRLDAIDMATGTRRWPASVATSGPITRSIASTNGLLYVGSGGATPAAAGVLAIYDSSGMRQTSTALAPGNTSTVSILDGRVFVTSGLDVPGSAIHQLYAFDGTNLQATWGQPFAAPDGTTLLICSVAGGFVDACGDDGTLYVVDASTGALAWTAPIHSSQSPNGATVGGVVYVTSDDQQIHALDTASHAELWTVPTDGVATAPAITDGRIIVGTSRGQIESFAVGASLGIPGSGGPGSQIP